MMLRQVILHPFFSHWKGAITGTTPPKNPLHVEKVRRLIDISVPLNVANDCAEVKGVGQGEHAAKLKMFEHIGTTDEPN